MRLRRSSSFEEFMDKNRKKLLDRLVGHLQRVKRYGEPDLNYQIPQEIPKEVWEAGEYLLSRGYNGRPLLD